MTEFYGTVEDMATSQHMSDDEAYVLLAAVRYQLPRRTYGSAIVCGYIERNIERISAPDINMLIINIETAFHNREVPTVDIREWDRILQIMKTHVKN